jgi:DNA-binding CsgD family transcriptional regulator
VPYQVAITSRQPTERNSTIIPAEPRSFVHAGITARQLQVLYWVQEGKSSGDIACILGLSTRTVEHHIEKVCKRLGVRTRVQAILKALDMKLIAPAEGGGYPASVGIHTRF